MNTQNPIKCWSDDTQSYRYVYANADCEICGPFEIITVGETMCYTCKKIFKYKQDKHDVACDRMYKLMKTVEKNYDRKDVLMAESKIQFMLNNRHD